MIEGFPSLPRSRHEADQSTAGGANFGAKFGAKPARAGLD
jgi:hypothetical protein